MEPQGKSPFPHTTWIPCPVKQAPFLLVCLSYKALLAGIIFSMQARKPSWAGLWSQLGLLIGFVILKVNKKQGWAHTRTQPPGSILIADETQFLVNSELQVQSWSQATIRGIKWITSACTHSLLSSDPPTDRLQIHFRYSTVTKQWRRCLGGQTEITLNCALNHSSKCWESREELKTPSENRNSAELSASQHKQAASTNLLKEAASQKLNTCWENLPKSMFWEIHICYQKCSTRQGLRSELPYRVCNPEETGWNGKSRINWEHIKSKNK